jgi:hypothetical protein
VISAAASIAIAGPVTGADAATQIGETFAPPPPSCGGPGTWLQSGSPNGQYAAPFSGVISSWSYQATGSVGSSLQLKVVRKLGESSFFVVGQSEFQTLAPNALNVFPTRIAVEAGDTIGIRIPNPLPCKRPAAATYVRNSTFEDAQPGETLLTGPPVAGEQLDIAAVVEPDCDSDGFGDETQDTDLLSCPPAPETTITTGPKDKIKTLRKRANARFDFLANEPNATFECSLDGAPVTPCTSPHTVEVRRGPHNFAIRAIDAGNNVEGTPATDDFTVKRKKKKKKCDESRSWSWPLAR